jgi:NAD(P)-dependent dehydrogenase (short-subunit alcohol dehydrogenase family)
MKGRSVILAGGSGGLGACLAEGLAELGAIPVIGCRGNRERADALTNSLSKRFGVRVPVVAGDVLEGAVQEQLIDAAKHAGTLYGLVPLLGSPARIPIEKATEQDLIDSMRVNFVGPVLLARDFAAAVGEQDAAIVFISTMQAMGLFPGSTCLCSAKSCADPYCPYPRETMEDPGQYRRSGRQ